VKAGITVADETAVDHGLHRLVQRDDTGAAQAQVVLQRHAGAFHLALLGLATQLPRQLGTLRQAGGPSGWPLDSSPPDGLVTTRPP
jgi:hypothetical protein